MIKITNEDGMAENLAKGPWQCPRCNNKVECYPAVSRRDNKTFICSKCGQDEALFDFQMRNVSSRSAKIEREKEREWLGNEQ